MADLEPWFWKQRNCWVIETGRKRTVLGVTKPEADRALRKLKKKWRHEDAIRLGGGPEATFLTSTVDDLMKLYLQHIQVRKSKSHYEGMAARLKRGVEHLPDNLMARDIRKAHLSKVENDMLSAVKLDKDGNPTDVRYYSNTTISDTIAAIQTVFNWAMKQGMTEANLLAGYEKVPRNERSRVIADNEFRALLRNSRARFRRFLLALRLTGCRPGEIAKLTWDHIQEVDGQLLIVLKRHKTITMQKEPKPRIIALSHVMVKMLDWISRQGRGQYVFLNEKGTPYNKDTAGHLLRRAIKNAKIPKVDGESIVLYSNRHTVATEALGKVTDKELAEYLGHTTTRMLGRYVHVDATKLIRIAGKIQNRDLPKTASDKKREQRI